MLAGLVRCTLASMDYSARRAGLDSKGAGSAHGTVTKREDGLHAFVAIETTFEIDIAPAPEPAALHELVARAEHGCFVSTRSLRDHVIAGSSTARRFCEHNGARRSGRPGAFLGARPPNRVLRRPRWHAVSRRGHRRDIALPARGQREHRRAVRDEPADDRARRPGAREGRIVPRLLGGRDRVRAEHDRTQLPAEPRLRTDAARGRRDRRHRARPRRERVTVARAGT